MFKRSPTTLKLCEIFRSCNGQLSYEVIEKEMGQSIDDLRAALHSARKYLERDEAIVFECIRGVGYKRLNDSEKVESTKTFTRKIRRTANNGVTRINTVEDRQALSNDDQLMATIQETALLSIQRSLNTKLT
jgi:DNA-binding winged helix-turn-helix (wHTH) protein